MTIVCTRRALVFVGTWRSDCASSDVADITHAIAIPVAVFADGVDTFTSAIAGETFIYVAANSPVTGKTIQTCTCKACFNVSAEGSCGTVVRAILTLVRVDARYPVAFVSEVTSTREACRHICTCCTCVAIV